MGNLKLDLTGNVAVVLGGTTGIGRALSLGLAAAGADVVASSRREGATREVAAAITALGRRTVVAASDVTDRASLEHLLAATVSALGKVDILVNAAGRIRRTPTLDLDEAEWAAILDTNLNGTLRGCQVFGRHLLERGYGRIINVASLTSFLAFREVAAYSTSKAAVVALTRSLAIEWGPRGVNVNAIAPGVFPTELNRALLEGTPRGQEILTRTPLRRFGDVEEVVGATVLLASPASSFINGVVLPIDGGYLASGVNQ
ncbi:MAG: SDR family oxidoreductase [Polyangiaceae bacterium]|nr:SDR family oxidoreductase [Polyangiaceae bacterium]